MSLNVLLFNDIIVMLDIDLTPIVIVLISSIYIA